MTHLDTSYISARFPRVFSLEEDDAVKRRTFIQMEKKIKGSWLIFLSGDLSVQLKTSIKKCMGGKTPVKHISKADL